MSIGIETGIFISGFVLGVLAHDFFNKDFIKNMNKSYDFYKERVDSVCTCPKCEGYLENMKNDSYWCKKCQKLYQFMEL